MPAINNSKELLKNYVDNDIIKFGDVRLKDVLDFEIPLKDPSSLHYMVKGCGSCTEVKISGNSIVGTLSVSKAIGTPSAESVSAPLNRVFSIYLDPSVEEFIADANKNRIPNPDKYWITITMLGNVILSD